MATPHPRLLALLLAGILTLGAVACSDDGGEDDGNGPSDLSDLSDQPDNVESPEGEDMGGTTDTSEDMSDAGSSADEDAPPVSADTGG